MSASFTDLYVLGLEIYNGSLHINACASFFDA